MDAAAARLSDALAGRGRTGTDVSAFAGNAAGRCFACNHPGCRTRFVCGSADGKPYAFIRCRSSVFRGCRQREPHRHSLSAWSRRRSPGWHVDFA